MSVEIEKSFDLAETLGCGQCFRWKCMEHNAETQLWEGVALGQTLQIRQKKDQLIFDCSQAEFETYWRNYFDLETDYQTIRQSLAAQSEPMKKAAEYAPGIHILRQEPWEALASFLISQNNNIPRIKGIIERFSREYGEKLSGGYAFPTAERIAQMTAETLAPIRAGFRAKYLVAAAQAVANEDVNLAAIRQKEVYYGRQELQKIYGVGPKVAECTLLYGFYKTEAFPMDVWMKRAMKVLFAGESPQIFGQHAGLAQQYIFHYSRMHPALFEP